MNPRIALLASLVLLASACSRQERARPLLPRPTEDVLDEGAEERQTPLRKAWFEHRHQAAPGVDWRELERANGEAQIAKRNRLARSAATGPSPWVERGSENLAGRMHSAAHSPDGTRLYAGTALGGVWHASLDGSGWTPFGDNLYGGAHELAVVSGATSGAPDVVLVATRGGLAHVTRDLGGTWEVPTGLGSLQGVRRVVTTSDGSEIVFLLRRRSSLYELVRSTDRMASFQQVLSLGTFAGDVFVLRDGRTDLYAMTRDGIKRSTDLGDTWSLVGPPPVTGSQAELAGSEAGAPRLWTVWSSGSARKLYRSEDAGASWTYLSDIGDYWNEISASIASPDLLLYGGVETHRSVDGGASFAVINTWGAYYGDPATRLHADIQGIDVVPSGPLGETWYVATDGGLYRSQDLLATVQNLSLSGLRVSQYYTTHTSSANPLHVVAGAQDQGYQRADAAPLGNGRLEFQQLISGDYGHLTSGDGDHGQLFSTYPGFVLCQTGESSPSLFLEDFPAGEDHAWMPPVVADPLDARNFFFCASRLYRYVKGSGNDWTITQWSTFDFGVNNGEYVSALVFSPLDAQRAYAVTDRGRLYRSTNRGVGWTAATTTGPSGQYFYGTALLASATDVDTVLVGGSGYSGPAIWRSTDGGATYVPYADGLPPTLVYCLGEAPDGSGRLFCGTETAVYSRGPLDTAWTDVSGADAPITVYWSVEALPHENTMRFGTYGRGIWDYQVDLQARATPRYGTFGNPPCLSSISPPELGGAWSVSIDPIWLPGATSVQLLVRSAPASGTVIGMGELLVGGAKLFTASQPANPAGNVFSFPVPNSPALVGLEAYAQGVLGAGSRLLCNALDLVVGY